MTHVRQQIREQVATTCAGLTTTGSSVFQSRDYRRQDINLRALLINTTSAESSSDTMGISLVTDRILTVVVEAYVKATSDVDDTVDTICSEVETALGADRTVNGLAKFIQLTGTEITYNGEGAQHLGPVVLPYAVQYRTAVHNTDPPV